MSGQFANGFAPVAKILTEWTLDGDANRMAAKLDGPSGCKLHHCSSIDSSLAKRLSPSRYRGPVARRSRQGSELVIPRRINQP
jgi:hypothetical protein